MAAQESEVVVAAATALSIAAEVAAIDFEPARPAVDERSIQYEQLHRPKLEVPVATA